MKTGTPPEENWIAVDWGTTNLRVWLIGRNGEVLHERRSNQGMGQLSSDQFESALLELVSDFLPRAGSIPVMVCGMAGSKEGWVDAGYVSTPCLPPDAHQSVQVSTADPRIDVRILPGIKQQNPPDVMRGEETQIAGYLADNRNFHGTLCLPGTHTKWVTIASGKIQTFQTFMTGELFSLMTRSSVLRHIMSPDGWDDDAFADGISMAMREPIMPLAQLFYLRAEALISKLPPIVARSRLSGHLIGAELRVVKSLWNKQEIVLVGEKSITRAYRQALEMYNVKVTIVEADAMTIAGLASAHEITLDTSS